jgi:ketosteroid isomerase-like protein
MTQSTNQPGAADLSKRTPEEIFAHHGQALGAEDLDATVMDFAATAVLVTSDGVRRGKDAIRNFFDGLVKYLIAWFSRTWRAQLCRRLKDSFP